MFKWIKNLFTKNKTSDSNDREVHTKIVFAPLSEESCSIIGALHQGGSMRSISRKLDIPKDTLIRRVKLLNDLFNGELDQVSTDTTKVSVRLEELKRYKTILKR